MNIYKYAVTKIQGFWIFEREVNAYTAVNSSNVPTKCIYVFI